MIVYHILFHTKSCLLRSTKSRIHSLWQFDKLVTNCAKRVHRAVLIWGTLEMGLMKYLWVSLGTGRSNKIRKAMFMYSLNPSSLPKPTK